MDFPKIQILPSNHTFPVENRPEVQTWLQVQRHLGDKSGSAFIASLNDFHLLYFLGSSEEFDSNLFDKIIEAILDPSSVPIPELRNAVHAQLQKLVNTRAPPSSRKTPDDNMKSELLVQLLEMGYTESQAQEAIFATGGSSVEAAVNYILSAM